MTPSVVTHLARRSGHDIHRYIGLGNQRPDQRALARADFAEEAEVNRIAPLRQLPELRLCFADVDAGHLGLAQSFLDLRLRQWRCRLTALRLDGAPHDETPDQPQRRDGE